MKRLQITLLFIFVALLPLLILRDFTPSNELRYISIADEALRNGRFFSFTNHGIPYCDKPPLYIWIVMLGRWIWGSYCMVFIGLFSLLPAFYIIRVMSKWCRQELSNGAFHSAPFILLSTAYFLGTAVVLRMDMLMTLFIVLALHTFYNAYTTPQKSRKSAWLFALYVFLGIFTKAFMGFLIPFISTTLFLAYKKRLRDFTYFWGWRTWLLILGVSAIWFACVWIEGGSDYLYNMAVGQAVERSVNVTVHKQPFYYYLYSLSYTIAPWTFYCIVTLVMGIKQRKIRGDISTLFLLVIVSTFVLLSCFGSKLEVYLLPTLPFLIYLTLMISSKLKWNHWLAASVGFPSMLLILAFPLYFILVAQPHLVQYRSAWIAAGCALLSFSCLASLLSLYQKRSIYRSTQLFCMGFFGALFLASFALPKLNGVLGYGEMAKAGQECATIHKASHITTFGIRRAENIDVYLKLPVKVLKRDELLDSITQQSLLITRERMLHDSILIEATKDRMEMRFGEYIFYAPAK